MMKKYMDMRWAGSHQSITNITCIATSDELTDDDRTCFVNDTYTIRIKLNHQRNDYIECLSSIRVSSSLIQLGQLIRDSRLKWPMNQIFRIFSWRLFFFLAPLAFGTLSTKQFTSNIVTSCVCMRNVCSHYSFLLLLFNLSSMCICANTSQFEQLLIIETGHKCNHIANRLERRSKKNSQHVHILLIYYLNNVSSHFEHSQQCLR